MSPWSVTPEDAWWLTVEPMSREEADAAARAINAKLPHVHAIPANPRKHLALVMNRRDVEMLVDALDALVATGRDVSARRRQRLTDWLERADPDDDRYADCCGPDADGSAEPRL